MLETLLSNRTVSVLWEALPRILSAGLTMTIPLTLVSFTLAMVLAVAVALVQYAKVPVLSQLARFYIWVIRGTPLCVHIVFLTVKIMHHTGQSRTPCRGGTSWRFFHANRPPAVTLRHSTSPPANRADASWAAGSQTPPERCPSSP